MRTSAVLIVSGAEPLTDTTTVSPPNPSHIPPYEVNPEIRAVTPTCVSLTWELSLPVDNDVYEGNIFRIASVKMWRIGLNILSVNGETEEQDLTIAGSITNIALGPFPLEATVRATVGVSSYYKPDGNIKEVGHIRGVDTLVLPSACMCIALFLALSLSLSLSLPLSLSLSLLIIL